MNAFTSKALLKRLKSKKNVNDFTLIELMIVVAILGVLTSVGLPELQKALNRGKEAAAVSTLTNAAKECSLSLISLGDASESTVGDADGNFADVTGTCEIDGTLALFSEAKDGATNEFEVTFSGGVPGTVEPK